MDGMLPPGSRPAFRDRSSGHPISYGRRSSAPPPRPASHRTPLTDDMREHFRSYDAAPAPENDQSTSYAAPIKQEPYLDHAPDTFLDYPAPPVPQPRQLGSKIVVAMLVLTTIAGSAFGGFTYYKSKHPRTTASTNSGGATLGVTTKQVAPPELAQQATTQQKTAELTTDADMAAAINAVIAANPSFSIGVSIVPIKTGAATNYGIDAVFDASGTGAIVTAVAYLKQVEAGSQSLDKQIGGVAATTQIKNMIQDGNTDAWTAVMNDVTKPALQTFAQSIGMSTYTASNNRMKPQDLGALLQQLYQGKILVANKDTLLGYMQQANKPEYIVQALPKDKNLKIYHKAGSLSDRSQDAAIIDNGINTYALVIYVKGSDAAHESQRVDIIHKITNATIGRFIDKNLQVL